MLSAKYEPKDGGEGWTNIYSSEDGLSSPDFTKGFICGWACCCDGADPDEITFDLKEFPEDGNSPM
ncbi:hypothetical protein MINTM005_13160 [Mycobacterium intracellulare]|nr:hypothetical protein MINTM005_13160 [Mycobacterium intracellulare]